jgi:hypothetical protein
MYKVHLCDKYRDSCAGPIDGNVLLQSHLYAAEGFKTVNASSGFRCAVLETSSACVVRSLHLYLVTDISRQHIVSTLKNHDSRSLTDSLLREFGTELPLRCVQSQKSSDLKTKV